MTTSIPTLILQVLMAGRPDGLSTRQLTAAVSDLRGRSTSVETVAAALANLRSATAAGSRIRMIVKSTQRRYVLEPAAPPAAAPAPAPSMPDRATGSHASLTAALLGDPLPGRSALDRRRNADRHA